MSLEHLPALNATLNATSAILLIVGYLFIRRGNYRAHAAFMISAFVVSSAFLVSYLYYHSKVGEKSTANMGLPGWLWVTYIAILFPHLLLAMLMLPLILYSFYLAYKRDWEKHPRVATPTFWIWLYVSITGVIIYWMLYHLFPRMIANS
jgi:uncharacterized membrane protein YozB (DUF420 family)